MATLRRLRATVRHLWGRDVTVLRGVSLFTNCGAGDVGYRDAGFAFDVMAELESHRLDVALLNHRTARGVPGDLRETLPQVVAAWRDRNGMAQPALLAACPPCQGMSSARSDRGSESDPEAGSRDPRNLLVQVVVDAAVELRPRVVVVENVPAFLTRQVLHPVTGDAVSGAVLLIESLAGEYEYWPFVTDLADHGVAQTRKRSFMTFVRNDEPAVAVLERHGLAPFPAPTHAGCQTTLAEAIASMGLRSLDAASKDAATDPGTPLHCVPVWSESRYVMVAAIPPNSGRTAWQNSACLTCGAVGLDDDAASCPECGARLPRPVVVDPDGTPRLIAGFRRSSYARMDPNRPAATVTTASGRIGSDNTLHPSENRVMSILECQLLQGFPIDFRWGDTLNAKGHTAMRAMIGEAVPPTFTRQHGKVIEALLNGRKPRSAIGATDDRINRARRALRRASRDVSSQHAAVVAPSLRLSP